MRRECSSSWPLPRQFVPSYCGSGRTAQTCGTTETRGAAECHAAAETVHAAASKH